MKSLTIILIAFALGIGVPIGVPAKAQAPLVTFDQMQVQMALQSPKLYAKKQLSAFGFAKTEFKCLTQLWTKESHWNYKADNPKSTAFGIAQMLNETAKLPHIQINKGIRYIIKRYDTPCNAWKFWRQHNYY